MTLGLHDANPWCIGELIKSPSRIASDAKILKADRDQLMQQRVKTLDLNPKFGPLNKINGSSSSSISKVQFRKSEIIYWFPDVSDNQAEIENIFKALEKLFFFFKEAKQM